MSRLTGFIRRALTAAILTLGAAALSGCASMDGFDAMSSHDPETVAMYGARPDERYPLPATDLTGVDSKWLRQQVVYTGGERPGTIVVDTRARFLYLVQDDGTAMRYGIGVGKEGLAFEGEARVGRKSEWPRWTPTPDMIARDPERYGSYAGGMEAGLQNPLGPRALYLFQGDRDTLFRIHGTTEPRSIGKAVSSGCIRMFNQDVIDLYARVPKDTPVMVIQDEPAIASGPSTYGGGYRGEQGYGGVGLYPDDRDPGEGRYERDRG